MLIDKRILLTIKNTKIPLILCGIFFVCGILFSLFYTIPEDSFLLHFGEIADIVTSDISISYYLKRLICEVVILTIVFTCGLILYCIPLIFVILLYKGFLFGVAFKCIIIDYSVGGFAIFVFIVVPSIFISCCAIAISCALACERLNGCTIIKNIKLNNLIKDYLFTLMIAFLSVLYILLLQIILFIPLNFSI